MTAGHSVEVTFGFYAHDPANAYCTGEREPLTIADQPAVSCHINEGEDRDIDWAVRGDGDAPCNFQFSVQVSPPRGLDTLDYRDPAATAQLQELAARILQEHT